jgi:hypothetical protein
MGVWHTNRCFMAATPSAPPYYLCVLAASVETVWQLVAIIDSAARAAG